MDPQKNPNIQSNIEQKEESWRPDTYWFQNILQSYNNQRSVVLAQRQTYKPMEQNREPRDKCMFPRSSYLLPSCQKTQWGKGRFTNKWWRKNWMSTCRRMKSVPYLTTCSKFHLCLKLISKAYVQCLLSIYMEMFFN